MKHSTLVLFLLGVGWLAPRVLFAQTSSGPDRGSTLQPLKVFAVTGSDAGQEINVLAKQQEMPGLILFIQADKWDRPVARFMKVLDEELSKENSNVVPIAIWLTDDLEKSKEYLPRAQQSMSLSKTTLAVYAGDKNGPPGWSINASAHLTAIISHGGRVTASLGYRSLNDTNVPEVLEKLKANK